MRPDRFETFATQLVEAHGLGARTFASAGFDYSRYGIVIKTGTGAELYLQITAQQAPGDDYALDERIVEGDAAPDPVEVPEILKGSRVDLGLAEALIRALLLNSGSREIKVIDRFSARATSQAVKYGMVASFHSGARIYVNMLHALASGQQPSANNRWPEAAVV